MLADALANGHQGIGDKVAAEIYKMHLQVPPEMPLRREADSYRACTGDMGVELGLPTFAIAGGTPEQLLPEWVERGAHVDDIERLSEQAVLHVACPPMVLSKSEDAT